MNLSMRVLLKRHTYVSAPFMSVKSNNVPRSNRCFVTSSANSDNDSSPLEASKCTFSSMTFDKPCRLSTNEACSSILIIE